MWCSSWTGVSWTLTCGRPRTVTRSRATNASLDSFGRMMPLADIVTPIGAPIDTSDNGPADGVTPRVVYDAPCATSSQSDLLLPRNTEFASAEVAMVVACTGAACCTKVLPPLVERSHR